LYIDKPFSNIPPSCDLSPYGKRCTGIHDPRVGGSSPSWLPLTETQGNTIDTDINVEALHQKRINEVFFGTPFCHCFSLERDSWSDLYKVICNIDYSKDGWIDKRRQRGLDPIYKLQIASQLRGTSEWQYKYRPQHVIHDEICMVIQKRAFHVTASMNAIEIPISSYKSNSSDHVLVREIAFGPDSDTTVRGVSLWFNIQDQDVKLCTSQQSKRFRYKRSVKKPAETKQGPSVFDTLDSFEMVRPRDESAFQLATNIMEHRLDVLKTELIGNMRLRSEEMKDTEQKKKVLQQRFEELKTSWQAWAWPINKGRQEVDKNTPVPPVDGSYEFKEVPDKAKKEAKKEGPATRNVWNSFVHVDFETVDNPVSSVLRLSCFLSSLPVFSHSCLALKD
jgi:hypothetical protein